MPFLFDRSVIAFLLPAQQFRTRPQDNESVVETEGLRERLTRCEALLEQTLTIVQDQQRLEQYQTQERQWGAMEPLRASSYIYGSDLREETLKKIYNGNAARLLRPTD